jgi:peptidoglycan/xylan/chitin deacetylase (PgdA/CDA1 family)
LWPQGYRLAVLFTFDVDVDSAEYRRGEDPVSRSRGLFTVNRGLRKLLKLLDEFNVKATFFVPGWVAERYGETVRLIVEGGHEVAGHGYLHERLDQLGDNEEEKVFNSMEEALAKIVGRRVEGFRAPYWRWSRGTLRRLVARGYLYDSSLMDDEAPYILRCCGGRLVELPVDWRLDDWPYLEYYRTLTPRQLLDMWVEEMEYAATVGGFVVFTMHPQCIARGARIKILEELLRTAYRLDAWTPTAGQLARYVLENASLFGERGWMLGEG